MTNYFIVSNVYEYGRNNPDVSYERACMATEDNEYFMDILDTLNEYQDRHGQILSSKKLREAVLRVMDEKEGEMERNIINISDYMERVDDISDSKERVVEKSDSKEGVEDRNDSAGQVDVLNDSKNLVVDGSDPKSDPIVATHTNSGILTSDTTNGIST